MPERRSNDYKLPILSDQELINILMISPWIGTWEGSAGGCRLHDSMIVIPYVEGEATQHAMDQVTLRLNTELKVPKSQIAFEPRAKRVKI